jgi:hypothetical protein
VVFVEFSLLRCPDAGGLSFARLLEELVSPVGVARAHTVESGPTTLGTPYAADLLGSGADMGVLEPPWGQYCGVRMVFGPADGDAENLPRDTPLLGASLVLEGAEAGGPDFRVETAALRSVWRELDPPLELSSTGDRAEVEVVFPPPRSWLRELDPEALGEPAATAEVVTRFTEAVGLVWTQRTDGRP